MKSSKPVPIKNDKPKGGQIWRVPLEGFVTPRLRQQQTDAIGFVHDFDKDEN